MKLIFFTFLSLKSFLTVQWTIRSSYTLMFTNNISPVSEYWNFFTSILILGLDVFFTLRFYTNLVINKMIEKIFIILGGPILLIVLLYGCIMDFLSYNDIICKTGCVNFI